MTCAGSVDELGLGLCRHTTAALPSDPAADDHRARSVRGRSAREGLGAAPARRGDVALGADPPGPTAAISSLDPRGDGRVRPSGAVERVMVWGEYTALPPV